MKFEVFENGCKSTKFDLSGAYLFGADGIAIRKVDISFSDGQINCQKPHQETAGLCLVWPILGFGKVLLPTTVLPERESPYILNVEIARAKLMQVMTKCEDWGFFSAIEGLTEMSEEAKELFIKAIQNLSEPAKASKFADESLKRSILVSEKLTSQQANDLFSTRVESHSFGRACLGCVVEPDKVANKQYSESLVSTFGYVTVPIKWCEIEPEPGKYDFSNLDNCIKILSKYRLAIGAGPLLCFSPDYLPKWLMGGRVDFENILKYAYDFISHVVERYNSLVRVWNVLRGMNFYNHFGFDFEQALEMTRAATMAVKAVSGRSIKMIEVTNPWGEYYSDTANTIPPLVYMDMIIQSGISFEVFGLEFQFGRNISGMHIRDMLQISAILDEFLPISKPIYITNAAIPSKGSSSGEGAGVWRGEWNEQLQCLWIEQFCKIALSKPFIDSVTYSGLIDSKKSFIPNSGLLTKDMEPKQSFKVLNKLHKILLNR